MKETEYFEGFREECLTSFVNLLIFAIHQKL